MGLRARRLHLYLLCSAGLACLAPAIAFAAAPASETGRIAFRITPQALDSALRAFGEQSGATIMVDVVLTQGKSTGGFTGQADSETALIGVLRGTGLTYRREGNVFVVRQGGPDHASQGQDQRSAPTPVAATDNADVPDIIVTAQKREESIQTVPIAISAFSRRNLDELKIEGGSELLRAIPNVSFSKNNFSGYNFSIRGVGTKAVSVTTDPAVAISFNNTPLIRNRLFEQEYFDVERIEVLRGPQGTLYGRNATGGVVNMITAKPTDKFEGELKGEVGNFATRRVSGMLNVPITDTLAVRAAGAYTKRDGFDYNTVTHQNVNGRDLWSGRVSAGWKPSPDFHAEFVWEHFNERDNRSRTGKQLCHRDPGPTQIGGTPVPDNMRDVLSQGCAPGSLYDSGAFGTPNGLSIPFVAAVAQGAVVVGLDGPFGNPVSMISPGADPYAGIVQSRNLREIATKFDPVFHARNDVYQLNLDIGIAHGLRFYSQTAYSKDNYYSSQDYNRFNSNPVFNDSNTLTDFFGDPIGAAGLTPGGIFTDPQLGPSNTIIGVDVNQSHSEQWSQEFRLQSTFAGPLNFSFGANYLHFKVNEDYYVFYNLLTALARGLFNGANAVPYLSPESSCPPNDPLGCIYIDPNPIDKINGQGHNYFRSSNIYNVRSVALFGETYWQVAPSVKITAGLRYTDDRKDSTPVPSQLLLAPGPIGGGFVNAGYPASPDVIQSWKRFTGRFAVDWKPDISFTDATLLYGSYSRGYKGGGTNPPGIGANPDVFQFQAQPSTFKPEYVNAFEVGMKNSFAGGKLTLNASAFYYDYQNYQVSKIVDRTAVNENFNAKTWGAELEAAWRPVHNLRLNANLGYLGTRIAKGAQSIDVMDRTQGNPDWVLVRPWIQLTSNCIAPRDKVQTILQNPASSPIALVALCGGAGQFGDFRPGGTFANQYGFTYNPLTDAPNGGQGFYADLGGNELPNSPHWTFNVGAQYTIEFGDWALTPRADYYTQSKSWARVYNTSYDRLNAWSNANLSLTLERQKSGLAFQFYVKNLVNSTPITDAFTNSDDSGLTTNVFTLDPRIFGFSITKRF